MQFARHRCPLRVPAPDAAKMAEIRGFEKYRTQLS